MITWSVKQDQGGREYQEDMFDVVAATDRNRIEAVAGVFDGHGNATISTALKHKEFGLVNEIMRWRAKNNSFPVGGDAASLFHEVDRNLWHLLQTQSKKTGDDATGGSTAIVAAIDDDHVLLYNVGDSRGVVVDVETGDVVLESDDHKPNRIDERARIMARGGVVSKSKDCPRAASPWSKYGYSTSRSFGDFELKKNLNELWLVNNSDEENQLMQIKDQAKPVHDGVMSSTPEIFERKIDLSHRHFIILASDGLWDEIESRQVGEWIRDQKNTCLEKEELIQWMIDTAKERGSDDNMTVVVLEVGEPNVLCITQMMNRTTQQLKKIQALMEKVNK